VELYYVVVGEETHTRKL